MFSSVPTTRVHAHIVAQIERAILEGRLRAGDKLPPERQLVHEFQASRVAVREALRALQHRGLIDVRQGAAGGHFIREADGALVARDMRVLLRLGRVTLAQLTEARVLIEPEIARLAALRATDMDLKALGMAVEERAGAASEGRHPRLLDIAFHRRVSDAAKNAVHGIMVNALMDLEADVVVPKIVLARDDNDAVDAAHRAILAEIAGGRPGAAADAMRAHVVDVQRRLARAAVETAADIALGADTALA